MNWPGSNALERPEHSRRKFGMVVERFLQAALGVQHEVDVVRGGLGAVPDKSERVFAISGATNIGA